MTSLLTCRVGVYTAPRHLQCSACETPFQQILISWIFPRFASVFLPRITKLRMHATFIKKISRKCTIPIKSVYTRH